MTHLESLMTITHAIEVFGNTDRGGAVKLACELRDAVQLLHVEHEERVERIKAKARRQNDIAYNRALDHAFERLEGVVASHLLERIRIELDALRRPLREAP